MLNLLWEQGHEEALVVVRHVRVRRGSLCAGHIVSSDCSARNTVLGYS